MKDIIILKKNVKKFLVTIFHSSFFPNFLRTFILDMRVEYKKYRFRNEEEKKLIDSYVIKTKEIESFAFKPMVSILVPIYNTPPKLLRETIRSVQRQIYTNWELVCINDSSPDKRVEKIILEMAKNESRIKYIKTEKNLGISGAVKNGFDKSSGQYIAHLDHDDMLREDALYFIVSILQEKENIPDYIYTDEVIYYSRFKKGHHYKPDFNHEKLVSHNYICHLFVLSRELVERCGGYKDGYDGSQDHELSLRSSRYAKKISHIAEPVYIWRIHKASFSKKQAQICIESSTKAIQEHITEKEPFEFKIEKGRLEFSYHIKRKIINNPLVSIFIPFKDQAKLTLNCINSIYEYNEYQNFEILLIDNYSEDVYTKQAMEFIAKKYNRVKILENKNLFNYSLLNNFAAKHAKGEFVLLLNNDILAFRPDWLYEMVQHIQRKNVGAVGPMLLYDNNNIQHAGVVMGLGGLAGHVGQNLPYYDDSWNGRLILEHNVTCITGAALMTKREIWEKLNGMDENFPVAYNDVDFCLQIRQAGYDIVYNPYSILFHFESVSRGGDITLENITRFRNDIKKLFTKWGIDKILSDPFYSKNLSRLSSKMDLKFMDEDNLFKQAVEHHLNPYKDIIDF